MCIDPSSPLHSPTSEQISEVHKLVAEGTLFLKSITPFVVRPFHSTFISISQNVPSARWLGTGAGADVNYRAACGWTPLHAGIFCS